MNLSAQSEFKRLPDGALVVTVSGSWKLGRELPQAEQLLTEIERGPKAETISFDASALDRLGQRTAGIPHQGD